MVYNFKVFKKCAPNGKLTLYMPKREFVDHISFVEPIGRSHTRRSISNGALARCITTAQKTDFKWKNIHVLIDVCGSWCQILINSLFLAVSYKKKMGGGIGQSRSLFRQGDPFLYFLSSIYL